jgi:transcriptional regulator with XRE-family HTH domain
MPVADTGTTHEVRETFGSNVRQLRAGLALTQTELSVLLRHHGVNLSQTMIAKLERGDRPTTVEEVAALARCLDVTVDALFERDEESRQLQEASAAYQNLITVIEEAVMTASDYRRKQRQLSAMVGSLREAGVSEGLLEPLEQYADLSLKEAIDVWVDEQSQSMARLERTLRDGDY